MAVTNVTDGVVVPEGGRAWLRSASPGGLDGFSFAADQSWPIQAGRICDLAVAPLALGLEMIGQADRLTDHQLGPVFADRHTATFCLAPGCAAGLTRVLFLTIGAPATITPVRPGVVRRAPAPAGGPATGGVMWLLPPTEARPALPGAATLAYLGTLAVRALLLCDAAMSR